VEHDIDWRELKSRGFVMIRSFLSPEEIEHVVADYACDARDSGNRAYYMKIPTPAVTEILSPKLRRVAQSVRDTTGMNINVSVGSAYFDTIPPKPMKPQAFAWHQDHDDWFAFQDHYNSLNFYIPVIKPERDRSNLTILPFDAVNEASPAAHQRLVGGGARHFFRMDDGRTQVEDDNDDSRFVLDFDIDALSMTLPLDPGDLLLSRSDIVHRTQDAQTHRVALKIIMMDANHIVTRARLRAGGITKYSRLLKSIDFYASVVECFTTMHRDEITLGELSAFLEATYLRNEPSAGAGSPRSVPDFLEALTRPV
jgi:hypothetical protein